MEVISVSLNNSSQVHKNIRILKYIYNIMVFLQYNLIYMCYKLLFKRLLKDILKVRNFYINI